MELQLQIKMNPKLYLRDPEQSELGKNIIRHSIRMIDELGFEDFTFKKLAKEINTTEASIYRYFENKHRLLVYIVDWFWTWMEYQLIFHTNNLTDAKEKIRVVIRLLSFEIKDEFTYQHIDKHKLYRIVIAEGSKSYLTKQVTEDNKDKLFKPYKDLCARVASLFIAYKPHYPYPRSLGSTLLESANFLYFFKHNLPSLTDFAEQDDSKIIDYLEHMVFAMLERE